MLATRIIPVLLCRGNALYKGRQFKSWRQVGHAMQSVRVHQARGVDELILLDISKTPSGTGPDFDLVKDLSGDCFMPLTVGGGIRSVEDVRNLLACGADKVAICSAVLARPALITEITEKFGSQALVVVIEVSGGKVSSYCGTGVMEKDPVEWANQCVQLGAGEIMVSSVDRDGMMEGYDLGLVSRVSEAVNVPVIALGGAGTYEHMHEAIQAGASAVAAGAMFQFTDQTPKGAAEYLGKQGVEVRL